VDDLRSGYDRDDDDLVRDVHEHLRRPGRTEPPGLVPPVPQRDDEVVCRSCRLVVRRREPSGVALLICDDCRWD
jgi:hypothetical protein